MPLYEHVFLARQDLMKQVIEVLGRHVGEAGIIYCIRRRDVDDLTADLTQALAQALEVTNTLQPASEPRRSPAPPPS